METWVSPISKWLQGSHSQRRASVELTVSDQTPIKEPAYLHHTQAQEMQQAQEEREYRQQQQQHPTKLQLDTVIAHEYVREHNDPQLSDQQLPEQPSNPIHPHKIATTIKSALVGSPPEEMLDNSNPVIADAPIPSTTAPIQQNYNSTYSTNGTGQDTQQQEQSHLADDEEANISPHQRISLRSVARAVEWMLNIRNSPAAPKSSETNRDQDQQQDQDGSSPEPNTKKKQRNRRKPRPPRPTISKTRLKVFVGTWNMMGQMPDIHDGLTGFIDISQKDSNRASHLKTSATDTRSSGQEQRPHMISPSASAPHICTPASTAASSTSTGLQLNLEVSAEAPHPKKRGGLLERIRCTGRSRKGELQPSVSVGHLPIQQQPSPSSPAGHAPGILKEPYLEMNTGPPYHIIAINTQECEREIREAVLFPSKIVWEKRLQAYLGPDYVMIKTETMAALHIAVFIWRPIEDLVSAVDSSTVATGIGGIVGNKGAVAISIYLGSMSLLFVNAHLTAHQSNTHARNSDYKRIIHELQLNDAPKSSPGRWYFKGDMQLRRHYNSPPALARQKSSHFGNNGKGSDDKKPIGKSSNGDLVEKKPGKTSHLKINTELAATEQHSHRQEGADENGPAKTEINVDITEQFDYTFWAGDLNYRVDLSRAQAEKCLEKEDLGTLLAHDQLSIQRNLGVVFEGFSEAPIQFKPTYKFDPITPLSDSRLQKGRQKTLLRRPRSMTNFLSERSFPPLAYSTSTLYRLENNKSCPTLLLGANMGNVGPTPLRLSQDSHPLSRDNQQNKWAHSSDNSSSIGDRSGNGNGRGNDKEDEDIKHNDSDQEQIFSDAESTVESHRRVPARGLSVLEAVKSIQRRQSSFLGSPSSRQHHQRRHSSEHLTQSANLNGKIEDAMFSHEPTDSMRTSSVSPDMNGRESENSRSAKFSKDDMEEDLRQEKERLLKLVRYDTSSKQRVPSWTDRILWKSTGGNHYLPAEIGDDTRSNQNSSHSSGRRKIGWGLLKKSRSRILASDGQTLSPHDEQDDDTCIEKEEEDARTGAQPLGAESILRLNKKKSKDSGSDGKKRLLDSLRTEFHHAGSKVKRDSTARSTMMSEDDEDRKTVIVKQYAAHHDIGLFSDHRPVTGVFAVRFDWNLMDRGVIGGGALNGATSGPSRWSPLDKVLEKMAK